MEPWKIKQEDTRQADSLPNFIIFCEDEVSEPIYFKYFETELIKVNLVEKQRSKIENVIKAITHCISEELMVYVEGVPKLKQEDTHIWCVFDRDLEEQDQMKLVGNTSFNTAIETAKAAGIKVAWSNDAFELWVLLHFEDVDPTDPKNKLRKTYYEKLTNIFKSLPNPNEDLLKTIAHSSFSYKRDLKQKNNFRYIVRNEIVDKTNTAIERAKQIEAFHIAKNKPHHEKSPCTMVYQLVEDLIRLGRKI